MATPLSDRKFCISSAHIDLLKSNLNIGAYYRDIAGEGSDSGKEVSKENDYAVGLDDEASKWPAKEDEEDAGHECSSAFQLLPPGEEDKGLLPPDDEGQAYEEQDLPGSVSLIK
jgi:hypothetical protein